MPHLQQALISGTHSPVRDAATVPRFCAAKTTDDLLGGGCYLLGSDHPAPSSRPPCLSFCCSFHHVFHSHRSKINWYRSYEWRERSQTSQLLHLSSQHAGHSDDTTRRKRRLVSVRFLNISQNEERNMKESRVCDALSPKTQFCSVRLQRHHTQEDHHRTQDRRVRMQDPNQCTNNTPCRVPSPSPIDDFLNNTATRSETSTCWIS